MRFRPGWQPSLLRLCRPPWAATAQGVIFCCNFIFLAGGSLNSVTDNILRAIAKSPKNPWGKISNYAKSPWKQQQDWNNSSTHGVTIQRSLQKQNMIRSLHIHRDCITIKFCIKQLKKYTQMNSKRNCFILRWTHLNFLNIMERKWRPPFSSSFQEWLHFVGSTILGETQPIWIWKLS